ncbi:MAG: DNA-binding domain-containing protein [Terracidiphilus sp.]
MSATTSAQAREKEMDLASLQREMAAAVMQPLTKDENMRETATDGRPMTEVAGSFIAPNSRLTAFERLEIYNRQYWYRILGALAEDFPALRALIGAERFEALSIAYLTENPSRSFTLRNLGSKLPEWLIVHPDCAGRRHRLAVDLARMEWAFVEAFDAPEREPLTQRQIAALQAESKLALQPCLQLVALSYPADDLVLELHQREKRQTSEAGVAHEDDSAAAAIPSIRPRPTCLPSIASICRSTIGASRAKNFRL